MIRRVGVLAPISVAALLALAAALDASAQPTRADYERLVERGQRVEAAGPPAACRRRARHQCGSLVRRGMSTMRVVNALVHANKMFDLLVIPGANHSAGRSDEHAAYGERKRVDFFVQHLLGQRPPDWNVGETAGSR